MITTCLLEPMRWGDDGCNRTLGDWTCWNRRWWGGSSR